MKHLTRRSLVTMAASTLMTTVVSRAMAKNDDPGVTDAEIKLGTTAYYSGPASTAAAYGLAQRTSRWSTIAVESTVAKSI